MSDYFLTAGHYTDFSEYKSQRSMLNYNYIFESLKSSLHSESSILWFIVIWCKVKITFVVLMMSHSKTRQWPTRQIRFSSCYSRPLKKGQRCSTLRWCSSALLLLWWCLQQPLRPLPLLLPLLRTVSSQHLLINTHPLKVYYAPPPHPTNKHHLCSSLSAMASNSCCLPPWAINWKRASCSCPTCHNY